MGDSDHSPEEDHHDDDDDDDDDHGDDDDHSSSTEEEDAKEEDVKSRRHGSNSEENASEKGGGSRSKSKRRGSNRFKEDKADDASETKARRRRKSKTRSKEEKTSEDTSSDKPRRRGSNRFKEDKQAENGGDPTEEGGTKQKRRGSNRFKEDKSEKSAEDPQEEGTKQKRRGSNRFKEDKEKDSTKHSRSRESKPAKDGKSDELSKSSHSKRSGSKSATQRRGMEEKTEDRSDHDDDSSRSRTQGSDKDDDLDSGSLHSSSTTGRRSDKLMRRRFARSGSSRSVDGEQSASILKTDRPPLRAAYGRSVSVRTLDRSSSRRKLGKKERRNSALGIGEVSREDDDDDLEFPTSFGEILDQHTGEVGVTTPAKTAKKSTSAFSAMNDSITNFPDMSFPQEDHQDAFSHKPSHSVRQESLGAIGEDAHAEKSNLSSEGFGLEDAAFGDFDGGDAFAAAGKTLKKATENGTSPDGFGDLKTFGEESTTDFGKSSQQNASGFGDFGFGDFGAEIDNAQANKVSSGLDGSIHSTKTAKRSSTGMVPVPLAGAGMTRASSKTKFAMVPSNK